MTCLATPTSSRLRRGAFTTFRSFQEGAVGAVEVFEEVFLALLDDAGVVAGDGRVVDDDVVVGLASDRDLVL